MTSPQVDNTEDDPFYNPIAPDGAFQIGTGGDSSYTMNGVNIGLTNWGQNASESMIRSLFELPALTIGNALNVLGEALSRLPMDVLKFFQALIPDAVEDWLTDVGTAVNKILEALDPRRIPYYLDQFTDWLGSSFNTIVTEIHQVMDIIGGLVITPINAAVQAVKDWWNRLTGKTQHLNDTGGFDAGQLVGTVAKDAVEGLTDLGNNVTGFFNGLYTALTGNAGSGSYVDPVDQLQYLADTVSGHSQAIAELQAANNGEGNGGLSFTDDFSELVTGGPPSGWTARSTNGITTYVDTHEGRAQWYNSGNANPVLMWQRTDPATANTQTMFQRVAITATTPTGGANASNRAYGRVSPDGTHYVVGYVTDSTVYIAYAAGGAETVVDSGPLPSKIKFSAGRQLIFECGTNEGENEYTLKMNGVNLQSFTDSSHVITDSTNFAARGLAAAPKGWGIGWKPGFNTFSQWQRPTTVSTTTISDNVPVDVQGHGFRVYRETTTASSAFAVLTDLSQFYDTIDYISPGSAWSSAGFTIPKSGMWSFSWRNLKGGTTNYTGMCLGLKVNGSGKTIAGVWRDTTSLCDSVQYYCEKGDVVSLYVSILVGTANMVGDSAGINSYFSGALMSG